MINRAIALGLVGLAVAAGGCGSGSTGPQGPQGDPGEAGAPGATGPAGSSATSSPSVSGISPEHAFLARKGQVTVSGFGTSWSASTTVDFGAGVKVDKITVASPTALVVDFTTDKAAAVGPRDVNVKDGTTTETYKGAFAVLSPISVAYDGTLAQGSIVIAHVKVLDLSTPLDLTGQTDPLTGQVTYTNLAPSFAAGLSGAVLNATAFSADVEVNIDVNATGNQDLDLVSGPAADPTDVEFPLPAGIKIAARTATPLVSGTPANGTVAKTLDSTLYSFTPASAAMNILDFTASSTVAAASPNLFLLPKSGAWPDQLNRGAAFTWLTSSTDPLYAIYLDTTGTTGAFTAALTATAAAANAPTTASDGTKATAVVASALPFVLTGGAFTAATSQDWVKITSPANKTLHAQSLGDGFNDVAVSVFASDGTTAVGTPSDSGGQADATFSLTTAGTYYVVFAAGTVFTFDPAHATYQGILRLQ
ncbi:MAG TPA: collagen-like protein [Polyangiaceae bacterium]